MTTEPEDHDEVDPAVADDDDPAPHDPIDDDHIEPTDEDNALADADLFDLDELDDLEDEEPFDEHDLGQSVVLRVEDPTEPNPDPGVVTIHVVDDAGRTPPPDVDLVIEGTSFKATWCIDQELYDWLEVNKVPKPQLLFSVVRVFSPGRFMEVARQLIDPRLPDDTIYFYGNGDHVVLVTLVWSPTGDVGELSHVLTSRHADGTFINPVLHDNKLTFLPNFRYAGSNKVERHGFEFRVEMEVAAGSFPKPPRQWYTDWLRKINVRFLHNECHARQWSWSVFFLPLVVGWSMLVRLITVAGRYFLGLYNTKPQCLLHPLSQGIRDSGSSETASWWFMKRRGAYSYEERLAPFWLFNPPVQVVLATIIYFVGKIHVTRHPSEGVNVVEPWLGWSWLHSLVIALVGSVVLSVIVAVCFVLLAVLEAVKESLFGRRPTASDKALARERLRQEAVNRAKARADAELVQLRYVVCGDGAKPVPHDAKVLPSVLRFRYRWRSTKREVCEPYARY